MTRTHFSILILLLFLINVRAISQDSTSVEFDKAFINVDSLGKPVLLFEDTALILHYSYGTLSVEQLAAEMSQNLTAVSENYSPQNDSIYKARGANSYRIFMNGQLLAYVPEIEANISGKELEIVAEEWRKGIEDSLNKHASPFDNILQYGLSLLVVLVVLFLLFWLLKKIFDRVKVYIKNRRDKLLTGIRIRDFELLDKEDELELIYKIIWLVRIACWLILSAIVFPFVFSLFPATEIVTYTILGYIYDPLVRIGYSAINYLPNLFAIAIIIFIIRFILKYLKLFFRRIEYGRIKIEGFYKDWSSTTYLLIKVFVVALGIVMIFPYLPGAQSDVFKGVSVFIGIIFSIGSTSVVGNLVAGLVITYMRPFNIGDRIRIQDVEGTIVKKTAFVIRIKTPKNEYITLPNSNVLNSHVVNYNSSFDEGGIIIHTTVTIGYDVPWRQVNELLITAADRVEHLQKDPKPFVLQKELGDFSVAYQLNAYSKKPLYKDLIQSLLHQHIQDIFSEAGVEILSPNYMATRDGNDSTVPDFSSMQPAPDEDLIEQESQQAEEHDEPDGAGSDKKVDDKDSKSGNAGLEDPEYQ